MDIFKSVIVWITGLFLIVVFFPMTFIIWLLVLPFDEDRAIVHWLLTYSEFFILAIDSDLENGYPGQGKGGKRNNLCDYLKPSVDARYSFYKLSHV